MTISNIHFYHLYFPSIIDFVNTFYITRILSTLNIEILNFIPSILLILIGSLTPLNNECWGWNGNKNVLRFHLSVAEINREINWNDELPKISKISLSVLQTSSRETGFAGKRMTSLYTSDENKGVLWNLINLDLFPFTCCIWPS